MSYFSDTAEQRIAWLSAAFLILIPVFYFLGMTSGAATFPAYICGLLFLPLVITSKSARALIFRKDTLVLALLLAYLGVTMSAGSHSLKPLGLAWLVFSVTMSIPTLYGLVPKLRQGHPQIILASAFVSAALSIWLHFHTNYRPLDEPRLYSMGGLNNPVIGGISYGVALIIGLGFFIKQTDRVWRALFFATCFTLAIAIFLTGTRSAWIGVCASCCVLLFISRSTSKRKLILMISSLGLMLFLVALIASTGHLDLLLKRSTSFRPEIWQSVLSQLKGYEWIFGQGEIEPIITSGIHFQHPHNMYLTTLLYGGCISLALLLSVLTIAVRNCLIHENRLSILPLLTFGIIVMLVDGENLVTKVNMLWWAIWLPIALSFTDIEPSRREPTIEKRKKSS